MYKITLGDLHRSDRLPFVHCNKPCSILPPTTQINHKPVSTMVQRGEELLEPWKGEAGRRKKEGSYNDLFSGHRQ